MPKYKIVFTEVVTYEVTLDLPTHPEETEDPSEWFRAIDPDYVHTGTVTDRVIDDVVRVE